MIADAIFQEVGAVARAAIIRRGAQVVQANAPRMAARLAAADANSPTFSTGVTVIIAGTTLAAGVFAGWKLRDWFGGKS